MQESNYLEIKMTRTKLFIANWKMHKTKNEALDFIKSLKVSTKGKVIIAPPFTLLDALHQEIKGRNIFLAAQNFYFEKMGAFTGEIAASMLVDLGVKYVLIGHSERRHYFNETNEIINKKIKKALESNLVPILCIGETLDERNAHETEDVLKEQLEECLQDITIENMANVIIAYEPVWAIGTGLVATSQQAEHVHAFIRKWVKDHKSDLVAHTLPILYGGSVKPDNIESLLSCKDIDGVLVGGASLNVEHFNQIIEG